MLLVPLKYERNVQIERHILFPYECPIHLFCLFVLLLKTQLVHLFSNKKVVLYFQQGINIKVCHSFNIHVLSLKNNILSI